MRLLDVIEKATEKADEPKVKDADVKTEVKKEEVKKEEVKETSKEEVNRYESVGKINASLFAFTLESPLQAINGIRTKLRKRKINRGSLSKEEKEKKIGILQRTYESNRDLIPLDDDEYTHLERAMIEIAKLNKSKDASPTMTIVSTLVGILIRRAEMFIDEE